LNYSIIVSFIVSILWLALISVCQRFQIQTNLLPFQAYAISALMKIYAFEVAARRKVDILPEVYYYKTGLAEIVMINE